MENTTDYAHNHHLHDDPDFMTLEEIREESDAPTIILMLFTYFVLFLYNMFFERNM